MRRYTSDKMETQTLSHLLLRDVSIANNNFKDAFNYQKRLVEFVFIFINIIFIK